MTKYAKCSVCGYVIAIYDDTDASDYVCPVDGTTLVVATRTEYMVTEKSAATFVVAASDSLHKERADYVCGGVDDLDFITTTVLPELPASGGTISLLEGNYYVSTNSKPLLISAKNNIRITGQGAGTHLKLANGIQSNLIEVQSSAGILITDLHCDGTTTAADGGVDTNQDGIFFQHVDDSMIKNVWTWFNKRHGILMLLCDRNEIIGCECKYNIMQGLGMDSCMDNVILGNIFTQNSGSGAKIHTSRGNSIAGNVSYKNTQCGIYLSHYDSHVVTGNICHENSYSGIYIANSKYNIITGNIIKENKKHGIEVSGIVAYPADENTIHGNTIHDNGKLAAATYSGIIISDYCERNNIQDNIIRKDIGNTHKYGIRIENANSKNTTILNNDLYNAGGIANFSDAGLDTMYYYSEDDLFMDVLAASANYIVNAQNLVNGAVVLTGTQPKYPRGLDCTITEVGGNVTDYTMTVVGTDAKGNTITDGFTFGDDGLTFSSDNAFDHITSVTLADVVDTGNATFVIGIDKRLGLQNVIYATGDIWKIIKNGTKQTVAAGDVDTDYDTYDMTTIGLAATDDFTIWYKNNLNIIS